KNNGTGRRGFVMAALTTQEGPMARYGADYRHWGPEGRTGILDTMVVTGRSGVRCGAGDPQLAGTQGCVRMLRAATGGISLERVAGFARRHPGTPVARMTRTMAGLSAGAASKIWVA